MKSAWSSTKSLGRYAFFAWDGSDAVQVVGDPNVHPQNENNFHIQIEARPLSPAWVSPMLPALARIQSSTRLVLILSEFRSVGNVSTSQKSCSLRYPCLLTAPVERCHCTLRPHEFCQIQGNFFFRPLSIHFICDVTDGRGLPLSRDRLFILAGISEKESKREGPYKTAQDVYTYSWNEIFLSLHGECLNAVKFKRHYLHVIENSILNIWASFKGCVVDELLSLYRLKE